MCTKGRCARIPLNGYEVATHYSVSWQTNQFYRYISELERERVQYFQRVFVNVSNRLKKLHATSRQLGLSN